MLVNLKSFTVTCMINFQDSGLIKIDIGNLLDHMLTEDMGTGSAYCLLHLILFCNTWN